MNKNELKKTKNSYFDKYIFVFLAALELLMSFTFFGYIHIPPISITFAYIPILIAASLKLCLGDYGIIGRIGGDEFVVIIRGISREAFEDRIDKLNSLWGEEVSAAVGHVWEEKGGRIERLVNGADEEMYRNKKEYHNNESKYSKQH